MHGKTSLINHDEKLFSIKSPKIYCNKISFTYNRKGSLPEDLEETLYTDDGIIMGVRHKQYPMKEFNFIRNQF